MAYPFNPYGTPSLVDISRTAFTTFTSLTVSSNTLESSAPTPRSYLRQNYQYQIQNHDCHHIRLQRISVNVYLLHDRTSGIEVLDPLQSEVFTSRELHCVLYTIDDSEPSDFIDETYVAAMHPPFFIDGFFRGFWVYSRNVGLLDA